MYEIPAVGAEFAVHTLKNTRSNYQSQADNRIQLVVLLQLSASNGELHIMFHLRTLMMYTDCAGKGESILSLIHI